MWNSTLLCCVLLVLVWRLGPDRQCRLAQQQVDVLNFDFHHIHSGPFSQISQQLLSMRVAEPFEQYLDCVRELNG